MVRLSDATHLHLKSLSSATMLDMSNTIQYLLKWHAATFILDTINDAELLKKEFSIYHFIIEPTNSLMFNDIVDTRVVEHVKENIDDVLIDARQIIIEQPKITIEFDYPLSHHVLLEFESPGGFSRRKLLECIYNGYKKIYDEEASTGKIGDHTGIPEHNRAESNGIHGIWGHEIDNLFIEKLIFDVKTSTLTMFIGS